MGNTKLSSIYDGLEKSHIIVDYFPFSDSIKAMSYLTDQDSFHIGINNRMQFSEREEVCMLMEEQAHYEVGIVPTTLDSNSYCNKITRMKNELRAKKWAVMNLIQKEKLYDSIRNKDYISIDELADEFEVTADFMKQALILYGII